MKRVILFIVFLLLISTVSAKTFYSGVIENKDEVTVEGITIGVRYDSGREEALVTVDNSGGYLAIDECQMYGQIKSCFLGYSDEGVEVIVRTKAPDILIERSFSKTSPSINEEVTVEVLLTNEGDATARDFVYEDVFPSEFKIVRGNTKSNKIFVEGFLTAGDTKTITYVIKPLILTEFESKAEISYKDEGEKIVKKSELETISVFVPYEITNNLSTNTPAPGEEIKYSVFVENKETAVMKINRLEIKLPSFVRGISWSQDITKEDDKTYVYSGTMNSESIKEFIVNIKSVKAGEHKINSNIDLTILKSDFTGEVYESFGVGISEVWAKITMPEKIKGGDSFDVEIELENKGNKHISGIDSSIVSDNYESEITKGKSLKPGSNHNVVKNIVAVQVDVETELEVKVFGSYIYGEIEYNFDAVKTINVIPIPKVLEVRKEVSGVVSKGSKLSVDVFVNNLKSLQVDTDVIEVIPPEIRHGMEGEFIAELSLNTAGEEKAYSYTITIPEDYNGNEFELKTLVNFEFEGDEYKIQDVKTLTIGGEDVGDIDDSKPEELETEEVIEDNVELDDNQEKQGFFKKILSFFANIFKKNG
jgi:uncharacterized repeat protein (TIGR01451 family)